MYASLPRAEITIESSCILISGGQDRGRSFATPDIAQNLIDDRDSREINRAITNRNGKRDSPTLGNQFLVQLDERPNGETRFVIVVGTMTRDHLFNAPYDHFYVSLGIESRVVVTVTRTRMCNVSCNVGYQG